MGIDVKTIITIGSLLGASAAIWKAMHTLSAFIDAQHRQDVHIAAIQREQTLLCYGILAALKGLHEQGCNGPVTEALTRIEKHLNQAAHESEDLK